MPWRARDALATAPDLLIVNKFGKTECEGGGCRPLIAEAVERGVPVLVAVPCGNLEGWRAFAGELAREYELDELLAPGTEVCRNLGLDETASADSYRPLPSRVAATVQ